MKTPFYKIQLTRPANPKGEICWLHGWGQTHKSLEPLAALFKQDFTNTLYDLPGFGKSESLAEDAGTEEYARSLIRDLENRKTGAVIFAGHSFGARVAIRLAAQRPDLAKGLILIAGAGLKRKRGMFFQIKKGILSLLGKTGSLLDAVFKTRFKEKFRTRFGSKDYREAGSLLKTFVKTVNEDLSEVAAGVSCPVILIYGENDNETPPEFGERYKTLIKGAKLKVLPGFGHLDVLTAGRHQCQHYINQFLAGLEA